MAKGLQAAPDAGKRVALPPWQAEARLHGDFFPRGSTLWVPSVVRCGVGTDTRMHVCTLQRPRRHAPVAAPSCWSGILSSLLASRFGVPILLVFLGVGMLAGEDGLDVSSSTLRLDPFIVGSGALAIILFDGGLRTRIGTVKSVLGPAGMLASVGVLITAGLTGFWSPCCCSS